RGPGAEGSYSHWTYYPEPEFVFYRVGSYSAVHPELAPKDSRSYYVEISGGYEEYRDREDELRERVKKDLITGRVISDEDEIVFMDLCRIPHAYVIFDSNYEESREQVLDLLGELGVRSCGRWGGWNYGGMEDAMVEGQQAAFQIMGRSE
ncbi:hypothetical protein N9232_00860, partial [Akkermansiaceae bacterium]|nr:hypothetical protein [Akkermansiaceae bacterium]